MAGTVTGGHINEVLHLVRSLSNDGDTQLSILALSLVAGCKSCGVSRDTLIDEITKGFDEAMTLVPMAQ